MGTADQMQKFGFDSDFTGIFGVFSLRREDFLSRA